MLHQIKAQQFYTDLGLQKIVEFKDFSRLLSDFLVLFKADLIFNDFSKKLSKFKYFSSLCEPWYIQLYTSQNENFKYGYPHSNTLLQFRLKLEGSIKRHVIQ